MFSSPIVFLGFASIALFAIPFAAGSTSKPVVANGTILGQVLLSPVCPVERNPPDPACAPKPYKTIVSVLKSSNGAVYKKVAASALGRFSISVPAGSYVLRASGAKVYPRCTDTPVKVIANKSVSVKIGCDTGIR